MKLWWGSKGNYIINGKFSGTESQNCVVLSQPEAIHD
jgi:hypothetical protein